MKQELTQEEKEQYADMIRKGTMRNMFDFGYELGWKKAMEFLREETKKFTEGFAYKKSK